MVRRPFGHTRSAFREMASVVSVAAQWLVETNAHGILTAKLVGAMAEEPVEAYASARSAMVKKSCVQTASSSIRSQPIAITISASLVKGNVVFVVRRGWFPMTALVPKSLNVRLAFADFLHMARVWCVVAHASQKRMMESSCQR